MSLGVDGEPHMIKLPGHRTHFRCECGSNIFRREDAPPPSRIYRCNACGERWQTQ